jgi:hypothetical protein
MSDPQPPSLSELQTCHSCGYLGGKYDFHRTGDFGDYDVCPGCGYTYPLYPNASANDGCLGAVLVATTLSTAGVGLALGRFFA